MKSPKVTDKKQIAQAIYDFAEGLDNAGNGGVYRAGLPDEWILKRPYIEYRRGILFYSTGYGWRVRKSPHWRTVFKKRFPDHKESENG